MCLDISLNNYINTYQMSKLTDYVSDQIVKRLLSGAAVIGQPTQHQYVAIIM